MINKRYSDIDLYINLVDVETYPVTVVVENKNCMYKF